jgi:hypothetical protein
MWPIPEFPSELTAICAFEHPEADAGGGVETLVAGVVAGTVVVTAAAVVVGLTAALEVVVDGSVDESAAALEPE